MQEFELIAITAAVTLAVSATLSSWMTRRGAGRNHSAALGASLGAAPAYSVTMPEAAATAEPDRTSEPPTLDLPNRPPLVCAFDRHRLTSRRAVAPVKAAAMLIQFMQDEGAIGNFTVAEIDEFWRWMCASQNLDQLHPNVVRSELSGTPGVWLGLRRLNGPEFREVRARTGKDRSVIYRIPPAGRIVTDARRSATGSEADKPRRQRPSSAAAPATVRRGSQQGGQQGDLLTAPAAASVRPSAPQHLTIADVYEAARAAA